MVADLVIEPSRRGHVDTVVRRALRGRSHLAAPARGRAAATAMLRLLSSLSFGAPSAEKAPPENITFPATFAFTPVIVPISGRHLCPFGANKVD